LRLGSLLLHLLLATFRGLALRLLSCALASHLCRPLFACLADSASLLLLLFSARSVQRARPAVNCFLPRACGLLLLTPGLSGCAVGIHFTAGLVSRRLLAGRFRSLALPEPLGALRRLTFVSLACVTRLLGCFCGLPPTGFFSARCPGWASLGRSAPACCWAASAAWRCRSFSARLSGLPSLSSAGSTAAAAAAFRSRRRLPPFPAAVSAASLRCFAAWRAALSCRSALSNVSTALSRRSRRLRFSS
jgi:hypothetical protein